MDENNGRLAPIRLTLTPELVERHSTAAAAAPPSWMDKAIASLAPGAAVSA
jgi:hypothetical protein